MTKAKKSKRARGRKLKVFRTPVGFHDAYVAAPTQKAALEAWGVETNLFARGDAEQVTEPKLTRAPLDRPGEVIRVLRGSAAEQAEALGKAGAERARKNKDGSVSDRAVSQTALGRFTKSGMTKKKKPSRAAVDKAEQALEQLAKKHEEQLRNLAAEEQRLADRRREAEEAHAKRKVELKAKLDEARRRFDKALEQWDGA